MSVTEARRNQIANPAFFRPRTHRPHLPPRVRLLRDAALKSARGVHNVPRFLLRRAEGFTYLGVLLPVTIMGFGLAAFGELCSHAAQRDKEQELLFVGAQFRDAIASYYHRSPGGESYPEDVAGPVE